MIALDIECVGDDRASLTEEDVKSLTKSAKTTEEAEERLSRLALNPGTGRVVCIALRDVKTGAGFVMMDSLTVWKDDTIAFLPYTSEEAMLKAFWKSARNHDGWITFNGRGFDVPYLHIRAARYGIAVNTRLTEANRFRGDHVDIADQVTGFGAMRGLSLHMLCRALQVPTPKDGIDGAQVGEAWARGEHERVGRYCLADVDATIACGVKLGLIATPQPNPLPSVVPPNDDDLPF